MTIHDIAKIAGVGAATVSRVINNSGYVSDDVRIRVQRAIEENGYVPNPNARGLKANSGRNIGLFVKGITNPFFNKMIRIIEEKCVLRGYMLIVRNVDEHEDELEIAIREARASGLCGVILMGGSFGYSEKQFRRLALPVVLVTISAGGDVPEELYSSVLIDDEKEGWKAASYLIGLGHRRIGFIYNPGPEALTTNGLRFRGYRRALEENGIPYDPALVADNSMATLYTGYATGFNAVRVIWSRCPDVTGIVAFSDVLALGAMKGLFSLGLKIPDNVSVVGFDGIEAGEYYQPSLDTIIQPAGEMALSSIEFLFSMIQGGTAQHLVYDAVLARRGSARKI